MNYKSLFVLFLITLFPKIGIAQDISIDSLNKMPLETLKLEMFKHEITSSAYSKFSKVYLKRSLKTKDTIQMCRGYYFYAYTLRPELALKYADTIIALSKNSDHDLYPTAGYILKAYTYNVNKFHKKALDNYIIALKYAKEKNYINHIFDISGRISDLKTITGDYKSSTIVNKNVYDLMIKTPGYIKKNKFDYFYLLYSLTTDYINIKEYDSANIYINKAFKEINPSEKYLNISYYDFVNLSGYTHYYKKQYSKAIDSLKKSASNIGDHDRAISSFLISSIYKIQNEETLFLNHALVADSLALKTKNYSGTFRELYENLIDYYKSENNVKKELKYLNRLIKLDSIL